MHFIKDTQFKGHYLFYDKEKPSSPIFDKKAWGSWRPEGNVQEYHHP